MDQSSHRKRSLLDRLADGAVLCAEGYLFELERRGYLQAGAYVPEVVLEFPEAVLALHREFLRAGSDVIEALTYYGHREKLRVIGKEDLLEPLQRTALALATAVAAAAPDAAPLVAGNLCNTTIWDPTDRATDVLVRAMFDEQVTWAADAAVDYMIAETFSFYGEAQLALEAITRAGLPAVVTFALHRGEVLRDGVPLIEACQRLEQRGVAVVGLNCARGPQTMWPWVMRIRQAVTCHVAALPVPYRTTAAHPTFQSLRDPAWQGQSEERPFPVALDPFTCHIRAMAEALGRRPPASQYSPDMSKHYALGTHPRLKPMNQAFIAQL
jgi:betaine-homocysteine S-methyltransferase